MPIETYANNPALRPTVLASAALKNVYRPSGPREARELPQSTPRATTAKARETDRAA